MAKAVKLSDIGEKLNVSAVTVSKALSGQKGVSDEMRQKIIALAEEMGYQKSTYKEKGGDTIGVIVSERYLGNGQTFYWQIYQEVSQSALLEGCFTMLEVITHEVENMGLLPKIITEQKVDGIIVLGAFQVGYTNFLATEITIPMVYLDTTGTMDTSDSVVSNNLMGGYRMTNYLFDMGHRRIAFVGTRLATSSIDDRYLGYLKSLMHHGITWREDWMIDDRDLEVGEMNVNVQFQLPEEMPTAFFCNCDIAAVMLVKKLSTLGYSVPEDISVVGFDNFVTEPTLEIGLTTYEIDTREMARRAVNILIHKLNEEGYRAGMCVMPGKFIERESVRRIGESVPFV